jgi:hypothetical protein
MTPRTQRFKIFTTENADYANNTVFCTQINTGLHGFFRQGKSKKAKGKSEDSPMGWTVVFNVSFFCFQIALFLEAFSIRGYYSGKFDKYQIKNQ